MLWPPKVRVDWLERPDEINAYADLVGPLDKSQPVIIVTPGMFEKLIEGDDDRLAFIVGHELAHLVLGHCKKGPGGSTEFVRRVRTVQVGGSRELVLAHRHPTSELSDIFAESHSQKRLLGLAELAVALQPLRPDQRCA